MPYFLCIGRQNETVFILWLYGNGVSVDHICFSVHRLKREHPFLALPTTDRAWMKVGWMKSRGWVLYCFALIASNCGTQKKVGEKLLIASQREREKSPDRKHKQSLILLWMKNRADYPKVTYETRYKVPLNWLKLAVVPSSSPCWWNKKSSRTNRRRDQLQVSLNTSVKAFPPVLGWGKALPCCGDPRAWGSRSCTYCGCHDRDTLRFCALQ